MDTLTWHLFDSEVKPELGFLKSNPQLTRLSIFWPQHPTNMREVVSLLPRSFSRLRSLRLTWYGTFIPEDVLRLLGTITSLEQICLAAGQKFYWTPEFLIDHDAMRHNLAPLRNLRKIAFDRDSYDIGVENPESYYSVPNQLPVDDEFRLHWERNHRDMIVTEARKYMRVFPKLGWLYIGQLPMKIDANSAQGVVVLSERDEDITLLDRVFGYAGKFFVE